VTSATVADDAARRLGADAVRAGETADAIDGATPAVVITPATAEGVALALAWAQANAMSIIVTGAGTKTAWGRPPARVDAVVSLARLNRVLAHEAGDLTATVEAGASLSMVNQTLGAHGQWLPLDPPFASQATIGGLIATGDSGPRRHRFGTPRDLILGVTVATTDGTLSSAGGRVVKNVAGYDLSKLVCGSYGQLAAIVSATFKLAPIQRASVTTLIEGDVPALARTAEALTERQLEPTAVDIEIDRGGTAPRLLVRFESVPAAVDAAVAETASIAGQLGLRTAIRLCWSPGAAVVRVSWLPADLARAIEAVRAAPAMGPIAFIGQVGVGAGLIRLEGDVNAQAAAIAHLRAVPTLGNVVVRDGSVALRSRTDVWSGDTATRRLGVAIKRAWDPASILGAGRGPL
jgi:glycolate oxidase FAD binding subunit